jgi:hypothetical protein
MNILLFFVAIIVSFIVVRIGAVAFQLTGLEWSVAKFQALSCFSGTGFTTREAELITTRTQRRRIASMLMVLGNAGIVTLIATFANTLRTDSIVPTVMPFLGKVIPPGIAPWVDLAVIIAILYLIYFIFTRSPLSTWFTSFVRSRMIKRESISRVTIEELVVATGGYGVSSIEVRNNSPMVDKSLIDSGLRQHDIIVLAIERKDEMIPNPPASMKILLGDRVVCFGKLENIRSEFCVKPS